MAQLLQDPPAIQLLRSSLGIQPDDALSHPIHPGSLETSWESMNDVAPPELRMKEDRF